MCIRDRSRNMLLYRREVAEHIGVQTYHRLRQSRGPGGGKYHGSFRALRPALSAPPQRQRPFERRWNERYIRRKALARCLFMALVREDDGVYVKHLYSIYQVYGAGARVQGSYSPAEPPAGDGERQNHRRVWKQYGDTLSHSKARGPQLLFTVGDKRDVYKRQV